MQHRPVKLALALAGVLACSLVTSTSLAYYRGSMGPKQCCKSHCRHHMPARAAAQCCRTHPGVTPAATAKVAPPDAFALALSAAVAPDAGVLPRIAFPLRLDHRGPPDRTLLSQHTSLAL